MRLIDKIEEKKRVTELVIDIVQNFFELNIKEKTRKREYVLARSFCYKLIRENTKMTLSEIAKLFNKNHATVLHNLRQLDGYLEYDHSVSTDYLSLNSLLITILQDKLLVKYSQDEGSDYDSPKYIELVNDFKELSKKYMKLREDYNQLSVSSTELSAKHKRMSELYYKREKYFQRNGFIIG